MNIGIDMMGGDFAPLEAVLGIKQLRDEGRGMSEGGQNARHEALGTRDEGEGTSDGGQNARHEA
ncbi:MAG: hypothetical protein RLZZ420_1043, partial [Bacteroidota bacterium]